MDATIMDNLEISDISYQYQNSDDQPKDLTVMTAKKMKPIPPPLNLSLDDEDTERLPMTMLKEFANFATSPKSPLMQKHLPFRKRAHMISVQMNNDNSEEQVVREISSEATQSDSSVLKNSGSVITELERTRNESHISEECVKRNAQLVLSRNRIEKSTAVPDCDNGKCVKYVQEDSVLDLSVNNNSVLLSPAPSSLGSSREELTELARISPVNQTRLWGLPWPPPIWHCFQSGTKLKLGSLWCLVEEMGPCPSDWPSELKVEHMSLRETSVLITFSSVQILSSLLAEVSRAHAFLVKDRGWTAVCGETLFGKYSVRCPSLQLHDIIMLPTIHRLPLPLPLASPDICERIKRFSFPPPDEPLPMPQVLSPPTTPTRKSQDGDKPKRPMNAFMLFAKRFRLELIQSHPGKDNRAISVILGEVWRTLPQEEREIYIRGARDLSEEQKLLHPDCWKRKRSHSTS